MKTNFIVEWIDTITGRRKNRKFVTQVGAIHFIGWDLTDASFVVWRGA